MVAANHQKQHKTLSDTDSSIDKNDDEYHKVAPLEVVSDNYYY